VQVENSGSTRKSKIVDIYLLLACITNLILALHMQEHKWAGGTFLKTAGKSSSSPRAAGVNLEERSEGSPHCIIFPSVRPSVWNTKTRRFSM
jgi:hypothetical protein